MRTALEASDVHAWPIGLDEVATGDAGQLKGHAVTIRVYIADDEAGIRRILKKAVDHEGMVARTFENGKLLLDALDELEPGVVLLDIRMPEMGGLEVLEAMGPRTRVHAVLMLSSHGDVSTAVKAMRAGAIDFIEKPVSIASLIERVRQLHQLTEEWERSRSLINEAILRLSLLSEREREVGDCLALGMANKEIARKMGISPRTVEAHRARLMQKLGVSSLADIVRLFVNSANGS
jgi:two-component system response regulator FixJ